MCVCVLSGGNAATLINDTETECVLMELVTPLTQAANVPQGRAKIHIVRDDNFNAFVRGGDDIYIYTGLLKQIKTPDALQAVVAHEMGHTIGGHVSQLSARMDAEFKRTMLIQALGVGLMVAGGNPSLGAGVLAGAGGVATQSVLAFSRDEERVADNLGIDLMIKAGQNPNGFVDVLEQMREITGPIESRVNPNAINHPLTAERVKNAREYIKQTGVEYKVDIKKATKREKDFNMVRAKLIGYLDPFDRVKTIYPNTDTSDAALYARAIANMRAGNLDVATRGVRTLVARDSKNPYFYELLGDIEYQFGHYDDSVDAYEKSLDLLNGDAAQIQSALALVLTERRKDGDNERAIELCKRSILTEASPLAYWVLARAYGEKDPGRSAWAMAEFYNMQDDKKSVKKYAKIARKKLKKSDSEYIKAGDQPF